MNVSNRCPTIVGTYKEFATTEPVEFQEMQSKITELKREVENRKIDIATMQSFASVQTSEPVNKQTNTSNAESQITIFEKQILRLEGLVKDKRPHSMAYHDPDIFKVSILMHDHRIEQFGKTYDQMLLEFGDEMGKLIQVDDLPE